MSIGDYSHNSLYESHIIIKTDTWNERYNIFANHLEYLLLCDSKHVKEIECGCGIFSLICDERCHLLKIGYYVRL